jgi:hypothetical protein
VRIDRAAAWEQSVEPTGDRSSRQWRKRDRVKNGKSIDTSMGLTPTGEVIMGTRSGDLDPGVLVYLMREKKFDAAMIEELVDHRSGLLGISGSAATCGGCMKPRRRTPSHDLPLRCSAIPCVSRWPR